MILALNDDAVLNGWLRLPQVLDNGAPGFLIANGEGFFEYISSDKERSSLMGRFMTGIYGVGRRQDRSKLSVFAIPVFG
jgi:hypothetical protein